MQRLTDLVPKLFYNCFSVYSITAIISKMISLKQIKMYVGFVLPELISSGRAAQDQNMNGEGVLRRPIPES